MKSITLVYNLFIFQKIFNKNFSTTHLLHKEKKGNDLKKLKTKDHSFSFKILLRVSIAFSLIDFDVIFLMVFAIIL